MSKLEPSPLRAPQPEVPTRLVPVPSLSAPQPNEAGLAKPLNAPQPFSNAPEADIESERRFPRTARLSSGSKHGRKSERSNNSMRRSKRRVGRDQKRDNSSRRGRTIKVGMGSSNAMEPENDVGAQPLKRNAARRKPSILASMAEASNVPYASVTLVGSSSTAKTALTSFEQSVISRNAPLHFNNTTGSNSNEETVVRQTSYQRKHPPGSRASASSFTGQVVPISRTSRMASSTDTEQWNINEQQGRVSVSARISMSALSEITTEDMFSSGSFSVGMGYSDTRDISGELSPVANVVDEAQIEAEFAERMKSRIVEAVEIRPSATGDGDGQQCGTNDSYTNSRTRNVHSSSRSGSGIYENISNYESSSNQGSNKNKVEEAPEQKATSSRTKPRDLVDRMQLKETVRCIGVWMGFFVAITILAVVLVVFLRVSQ